MKVTLIQETPDILGMICDVASICYGSDYSNADTKKQVGMVKRLYNNGHHSVFEHIYFTFKIEGISRACSHQLVRHRHASYTQRSQRYCRETEADFVVPAQQYGQKFINDFSGMIADAQLNYNDMLMAEIEPEDARYVLPNAMETALYMTLNLRELIHIANERLCTRAQWEIRHMVGRMVGLVDPSVQPMLVPKCQSGYIICHNPCGGTDVK